MPGLNAHQSATSTKLLMIGDSGVGKTSALVSLVAADYKLRILDYDNGLDHFVNLCRKMCTPEQFESVRFVTLTDKMKIVAGKPIPDGVPQAFQKGLNLMTKWKDGDEDLGNVSTWGEQDVLVIDSLTFFCKASLRQILAINGRSGQQPHLDDWGKAMAQVEEVLSLLYSDAIHCNVAILTHVDFIEDGTGTLIKGLPMSIGKKLSPKVPRYFNSVLLVDRVGSQRVIRTRPKGLIEAKTAAPDLPETFKIETGLAEYFNRVRGQSR